MAEGDTLVTVAFIPPVPSADHGLPTTGGIAPRISAEMDRFMSALASEGRTPSRTIDVGIVPASQIVADRFGIDVGSRVVARQRIRSIDGEPFNINDTFYPYDLAASTEIM
jgi:GntR family transcriptional regulator